MADFNLRQQSDRYLLGELTLKQLNESVSESIIHQMRYGERDVAETNLAAEILRLFCVSNDVKKIHGYFDEEEFRMELAAYLYLKELNAAQSKKTAKAAASAS